MKTNYFKIAATVIMVALLSSSCDELLDDLGFDITTDYYEFEITILPTLAGEQVFSEEVFPNDLDSIIDANGQNIADLNEVFVRDAKIEIMNKGEGKNFDAFASITAEGVFGNKVTELAIANNIQDGVDQLIFDVTDENLTEFLNEQEYQLKVKGYLDQELTDTLVVKGKIRYDVGLALGKGF